MMPVLASFGILTVYRSGLGIITGLVFGAVFGIIGILANALYASADEFSAPTIPLLPTLRFQPPGAPACGNGLPYFCRTGLSHVADCSSS